MFYVATPSGISITEMGRSPIFISTTHEEFDRISKNIKNMSFNEIQDLVDVKNKVLGYINENTETYYNDNQDLEMQLDITNMSDYKKNNFIDAAIDQISDNKDDDELSDKARKIIELIRSQSLNLVGIKLIFE